MSELGFATSDFTTVVEELAEEVRDSGATFSEIIAQDSEDARSA